MDVRIIQQRYNVLLKRKEVTFQVNHKKTGGTPTRLEIRDALAKLLKAKRDVVYVKRVETKTGTMTAIGEANAYDSLEQAKSVEPEYIIARNMPPKKKEATSPTTEETKARNIHEPAEKQEAEVKPEQAKKTEQPKEE